MALYNVNLITRLKKISKNSTKALIYSPSVVTINSELSAGDIVKAINTVKAGENYLVTVIGWDDWVRHKNVEHYVPRWTSIDEKSLDKARRKCKCLTEMFEQYKQYNVLLSDLGV